MLAWFRPKDSLDEADVNRGLRAMIYDAVSQTISGAFQGGAFLTAYVLLLGASNAVIGLLSAMGSLSGLLQLPAVNLVDKIGNRKAVTIIGAFLNRISWVLIATIPFFAPQGFRIPLLMAALVWNYGVGSVVGCAFNSWQRDIVP